jgi:PAS domain S-box-containing protein
MTRNGTAAPFPFKADVVFQPGDIVFATDRLGCVVYWNKEAEDISGYRYEEVVGKPYGLACRLETKGEALIDLGEILAGRDFAGARRCHTRTGGEAALYLFATVGRNQAGEAAGVVFVARDVTGLWNAEAAIQASADKYRVLFENTLDAVAIADLKGQVLEANPACFRSYGYTLQDVNKVNLLDLVAPEDRPAAAKLLKNLVAGQQVVKTLRVRRKDGTGFVVDLVASTLTVGGERRILAVTRDATERVRAEQARAQSELMYRTVFESANDAVFVEAVDGRILDVNRHGCELLGYAKSELVRRQVADLVPAESRVWLQRVTDAVLRDGTLRAEAVRVHKDGRRIPVEMSAAAMRLDGQTVVLSIVRDITERKRAEQALREEKERSQTYLALAGSMLVALDASGNITLLNRRACQVLGVSEAEALGRNWFDTFVPARYQAKVRPVFEALMSGNVEPVEYHENPVLTATGAERLIAWHNALLRDEQGRPTGTLSSGEDVTDRELAVKALRESEEKYRSVVERASDGICVVQESRLKYVNPRLAQLVGYEPSELVGKEFMEYVHPEDRQTVADRYRRRFAGGQEPETYSVRILPRSGGGMTVEINAALATYDGAPAEIVLVRDVTERVRAEQALRESERRYRTALEAMRDPVHLADPALRIVMVNQALTTWLRQIGVDNALLGKTVFEAFPFLPDRVREEYRRAFETGEPVVTEEEITVGGRTFNTETTKTPVTEHGRVVRVLTSIRDVTEQKRLAKVAAETADELRAVLDNSPDAIAAECEGVLVYANQKYARLLGYDSPAEVIGRKAVDFDAPEDRELLAGYTRLREQGKAAPTNYTYHALRRDGTTIPLEATISTYRSLGRLHVLAFIREAAPSC